MSRLKASAGYGRLQPRLGRCMRVYDLDKPGTYRIIMMYTAVDVVADIDSVLADTVGYVDFDSEPTAVRRLADTATLVVTP